MTNSYQENPTGRSTFTPERKKLTLEEKLSMLSPPARIAAQMVLAEYPRLGKIQWAVENFPYPNPGKDEELSMDFPFFRDAAEDTAKILRLPTFQGTTFSKLEQHKNDYLKFVLKELKKLGVPVKELSPERLCALLIAFTTLHEAGHAVESFQRSEEERKKDEVQRKRLKKRRRGIMYLYRFLLYRRLPAEKFADNFALSHMAGQYERFLVG